MHRVAGGVVDRLLAGEELAKSWRQNQDYTEEARARAVAAARQAARDEAVSYAKAELSAARARSKAAKEAHAAAYRAALAGVDVQQQLLIAERAKAAAGDVGRLLAIAQEALQLVDFGQLRAARHFVLPALRANVGARYGDGFSRPTFEAGDYMDLQREIDTALQGAEPPELFLASQDMNAAKANLLAMRQDLERVNQRIADTTGGPGPLAEVFAGEVGVIDGSIESGRLVIGRRQEDDGS